MNEIGELFLVMARFAIALIVIYGICAIAVLILKTILNSSALMLGMVLRTAVGKGVMLGCALWVVYLALKGWPR